MTKKTRNNILLFLLLLVAAAGIIGYKMWNKPHRDVADANAIKATATALYDTYKKDSVTARKQFTDKIVEVTGTALKPSVNQDSATIVMLKTNEEGAFINCTFEVKPRAITEGETVVIRGICSGYSGGDADMGLPGDVVLIRCQLTK
jgi:hypothetical protein